MSKYGNLYKTAEFLGKIVQRNTTNMLVHSTIEFLKTIDNLQSANALITLSIHAGDGIWFYRSGTPLFFIKPTQRHILFHIFEKNEFSEAIMTIDKKELFRSEHIVNYANKVWRIGAPELEWIQEYLIKKFPPSEVAKFSDEVKHPRYIPGEIRQAVLESFIQSGRLCNGVAGKTKRHRLERNAQIEFDHILPHSEGGSNGFYNVQVLCVGCNRIKRATAK